MIDYITNTLIALVICAATLVCGIGISTTLSASAKAETISIDKSMDQLEKLYNELYTFHKSPKFLKWGYGTMGKGEWADTVRELDKDKELKSYIKTLVPEKVETEFLFQPIAPMFMWHLGRHYMSHDGHENKYTLSVKNKFEKLFKLHKSRKK